MERNPEVERRLAVDELVHAADEQAPCDQACNYREGAIVHRLQCRLVARAQFLSEELYDDVAVSGVAVGEKANTATPQASSVIS